MDDQNIVMGVDIRVLLDITGLKVSSEALAKGMDVELDRFQQWFIAQGNAPLVKMERAILKTYLAWKLLHEEGCPASQA